MVSIRNCNYYLITMLLLFTTQEFLSSDQLPFNGTIVTTFFSFPLHNIQVVISKDTANRRHFVRLDGDILYYNVSRCDQPDRTWAVIVPNIVVALVCLASFGLQLSFFRPFWRMVKMRGPAFYLLLNLVSCSGDVV
jgi:hypothetical protein